MEEVIMLRFIQITCAISMIVATSAMTFADIINVAVGESVVTAVAGATAGDEVVLAVGTHATSGPTLGAGVTLRSTDPDNPAIVATTILDAEGVQRVLYFSGATEATLVTGLTLTNGYVSAGGTGGVANATLATFTKNIITANTGGYGGCFNDCDGLFDGNTITNNTAQVQAGVFRNCDGVISNNIISDNTSSSYGGVFYTCGATVSGNTFTNNGADFGGVFCYSTGLIERNTITGSTSFGGAAYPEGCVARNCTGATFQNNMITGNGTGATYIYGVINNCPSDFYFNTIVDNLANGGNAFHSLYSVASNDVMGNIVYGNAGVTGGAGIGDAVVENNCLEGWTVGGTGNIDADPLFVGGGNYQLDPSSPCVNVAPAIAGIDDDHIGNPRPSPAWTLADMGCYEELLVPVELSEFSID